MIKDGGPAFPQPNEDLAEGISKLEYYAAAVLPKVLELAKRNEAPEYLASRAFDIAEAMVSEFKMREDYGL